MVFDSILEPSRRKTGSTCSTSRRLHKVVHNIEYAMLVSTEYIPFCRSGLLVCFPPHSWTCRSRFVFPAFRPGDTTDEKCRLVLYGRVVTFRSFLFRPFRATRASGSYPFSLHSSFCTSQAFWFRGTYAHQWGGFHNNVKIRQLRVRPIERLTLNVASCATLLLYVTLHQKKCCQVRS